MSVILRLIALWEPIEGSCSCEYCEGHTWAPLPVRLKPRPILDVRRPRYRSALVKSVESAVAPFPRLSLRRLWRKVQGNWVDAISLQVPELSYFRNLTA